MRPASIPLTILAAALLACATACHPSDPASDAATDSDASADAAPVDFFRLGVNGASGGSLLSAWVQQTPGEPVAQAATAFVAGGFVGVNHAMLTDGVAGRLVEYVRPGQFVTRCTTDQVLWAVTGVRDTDGTYVVFAAGENGRILRYRGGHCDVLGSDATYTRGAPTFWGVAARAPDDVWLAGGRVGPVGAGLVAHWDGTSVQAFEDLPNADTQNFYRAAVAHGASGDPVFVVGTGATILRLDPTDHGWHLISSDARASDNLLFTVSCQLDTCVAAGGDISGLALQGGADATSWTTLQRLGGISSDELPGLNGAWLESSTSLFLSGPFGVLMHAEGMQTFRPHLSQATITAVAGAPNVAGQESSLVIAVGGELGVADAGQRSLIIVRGDDAPTFSLDGRVYPNTSGLSVTQPGYGQ